MPTRKEKVLEFMDGFRAIKRRMAFKPFEPRNMPRITASQLGVLMTLGCAGEHTVKDVAKALGASSSAATQLIDGLVENGYVLRKGSVRDRRTVALVLSTKTKKHVEKMRGEVAKQFLTLFEALNDREFDQFMLLHKKIFDWHIHSKK